MGGGVREEKEKDTTVEIRLWIDAHYRVHLFQPLGGGWVLKCISCMDKTELSNCRDTHRPGIGWSCFRAAPNTEIKWNIAKDCIQIEYTAEPEKMSDVHQNREKLVCKDSAFLWTPEDSRSKTCQTLNI